MLVVGRIQPAEAADGPQRGMTGTVFRLSGDLQAVQPESGDWIGRPVRLDRVYAATLTHRQVFRETAYPLVDALTRGESSSMLLFGGEDAGKWRHLLGQRQRPASGSPSATPPGERQSKGEGGEAGLLSMMVDMLYDHVRHVACASHRFRLSCTACELVDEGKTEQPAVRDILAGATRENLAEPKGPPVLLRRDAHEPSPWLARDDELGICMHGLEERVEDFEALKQPKTPREKTAAAATALKQLLHSRLRAARAAALAEGEVGCGGDRHYLVTFVLQQMKRPTFQVLARKTGTGTEGLSDSYHTYTHICIIYVYFRRTIRRRDQGTEHSPCRIVTNTRG